MIVKFVRWLLRLWFRVEVKGIEHYHQAGDRVLIVANHVSFLDPVLLATFLPDDITFAINTHIARSPWIKPFLRFSQVFVMDPSNPLSSKALIKHLKSDGKAAIFPEGRITVTGSLMKIYDGTGMVADKSQAKVLPIRIDGAEYTYFSRLQNVVKRRLFPKITINIQPPKEVTAPSELSNKQRRKYCGRVLADLMTQMVLDSSDFRRTIFTRVLEARKIYGGRHEVIEDLDRSSLSYNKIVSRSIIIGLALQKITKRKEVVGVMLPNSSKTLNVILGLQLYGRTPAMLNFSTGSAGMTAACQTCNIRQVITSRRFIEAAKMQKTVDDLKTTANIVFLEDIAKTISILDKLKGIFLGATTSWWFDSERQNPGETAVVIFTSGSEGKPKGVALSHANLFANTLQLGSRINFNAQDIILNVLPMFHSFGFTAGTILPILHGLKSFLYPSPLHFNVIPEIAYEINATVLFGTNTFLAAYGKAADPYDFFNMRYVFAGAEKLQENTRYLWMEKFGIRIIEGYGATETSPVLAANTPMEYKAGTVGRLMPGVKYQLEPIEGISEGGLLHVSGPNIMRGYYLADNPGVITPPKSVFGEGWYDTGDIVTIDDEGYISICGRNKRFAKVGGEMISLTATEQLVTKAWPDHIHAVVSLPDEKKGEQLILVSTCQTASVPELSASAPGVAPINLPKIILTTDTVPILATGKIDYPAVTELAARAINHD